MTKTLRITTLGDAIAVATTLTKSWFRGNSRMIGSLVPRLFRPGCLDSFVNALRPDFEMATIEEFKRRAPAVSDVGLPSDNDRFGWLCLMQHYGTPTRLLDWTENALVALYFAVSSDPSEDGELWSMLPWALNKAAGGGWGVPLASKSRHLKYLLDEPYWHGNPQKLAETLGLDTPVKSAMAVEPPFFFRRMAAQSGAFTIHPFPEEGGGITEVLTESKHLARYIIPASSKAGLERDLRALGFSERHLFPDLDGLSRAIRIDSSEILYAPPEPPECSGEIG